MTATDRLVGPAPAIAERRWRWSIPALLLADLALVVFNGNWLAAYLRDQGPPFPPDAGSLIFIALMAIALGLIVASPAFALISRLGSRTMVRPLAGVLAVLVGMCSFLVAAQVNDAILVGLDLVPGGRPGDPVDYVSVVVAPAVEEPVKLLVVGVVASLLRPRFGIREGIIVGLLVGIGATLVEAGANLQVQYAAGGDVIYGTTLAVRFGLFGLGLHAVTAALTGAGLGAAVWSAPRRRIAVLGLSLAAALAVHVVWNLVASRLTIGLVKAMAPEPAFASQEPYAHHVVWIASSIVTAVLLAPAAVALTVAWRRSSRSGRFCSGSTPAGPRKIEPSDPRATSI
jgi:RsiW-degrading membrane proteinase PrsW (M82 family)